MIKNKVGDDMVEDIVEKKIRRALMLVHHESLMDIDKAIGKAIELQSFFEKKEEKKWVLNQLKFFWKYVSSLDHLTEEHISKYRDYIDWKSLSSNRKIDESFLLRHKDKIEWKSLKKNVVISEDFYEKHSELVPIKVMVRQQKLSENFLEKHKENINWGIASRNQKLSKEMILKYIDKICFKSIMKYQEVDWPILLKVGGRAKDIQELEAIVSLFFGYQKLTIKELNNAKELEYREVFPDFFKTQEEKKRDYVSLDVQKQKKIISYEALSSNPHTPLNFLEENTDRKGWFGISFRQDLTEEFVERNREKIIMKYALLEFDFSMRFLKNNIDEIIKHSKNIIRENQKLNSDVKKVLIKISNMRSIYLK